ncbi:MAG: hypothetical protein IT204_26335 [Fimbriimonadaceae bacterium]|nr:hypothetical protein [Fimbriimonadaceae bacterium]
MTLTNLYALISALFHNPDLEVIRAVVAAFAAHKLNGQPVWLMLVGPPSSMKTTSFEGLKGLSDVHFIDSITPKTFISGQLEDPNKPNPKSPSFLHRAGADFKMVVGDFSTILSMSADKRDSILADLRRLYDGELSKEFGHTDNSGSHSWKGRITLFVAATPEVDNYKAIAQSLGERFITIRVPRPDGEAARMAMDQDKSTINTALQKGYKELLESLPAIEPSVPDPLKDKLVSLAEFTVIARTHVQRNSKKEIDAIPYPEGSTRLAQQLTQLAKGSALLEHRSVVEETDYQLAVRIAFDSMPENRRTILKSLIAGQPVSSCGIPKTTLHYGTEELEVLGLLAKSNLGGGRLSPQAIKLLTEAGILNSQPQPATAA